MPVYDFECRSCKLEFEEMVKMADRNRVKCPDCNSATKILIGKMREPILFPEGVFDIGLNEIHISSKRQLREEMMKHNDSSDEFRQSYAKYDDGYGGW